MFINYFNDVLYFTQIGMPLIEVHQTRSFEDIPTIDITFINGIKDTMVLERFYARVFLARNASILFTWNIVLKYLAET